MESSKEGHNATVGIGVFVLFGRTICYHGLTTGRPERRLLVPSALRLPCGMCIIRPWPFSSSHELFSLFATVPSCAHVRSRSQPEKTNKSRKICTDIKPAQWSFSNSAVMRCYTTGRDHQSNYAQTTAGWSGDFRNTLPFNWFIHQSKMVLPHASRLSEYADNFRYPRMVSPNFVSQISPLQYSDFDKWCCPR